LQSARLERITINFGKNALTGAVFLDMAKAFNTVWNNGLLYKLTIVNFPSYLVHTISSDVRGVVPNWYDISSWHAPWGGTG
jgi:hypothetical protein